MVEITTHDGDRIRTEELSWLPLEALLFRLSAADKRDLFGQSPTDNVIEIAARTMHAPQQKGWIIFKNGRPVASFGVYEVHRGVFSLWALGADEDPAIAMLMLGPLFDEAIPHVRANGGRRLECRSRVDRKNLCDRLRLLGFKIETVLHRWGTDGSDYVQFVYLLPDEREQEIETVPPIIPAAEVLPAAPAA